jgi:drug/metabolite transporter (DMT)-like permease
MNRLRADLMLLLGTLIWGTTFIAQKHANDSMGPLMFVGVRFLVSCLALAPFALFEARQMTAARLKPGDLRLAALIGLCLFTGAGLQQMGLVSTTATNGGFLTALYVIFVPLIVWALTGVKPRAVLIAACIFSVTGAWLLTVQGPLQSWNWGDALVLIADIAWATHISLAPIFLKHTHRPLFLAFMQYGIVATLGLLAGFVFEAPHGPVFSAGFSAAIPSILYAGLLSGGIAFTFQILAQQYTPAPEAALIMSLEAVFAALAGAVLLSEQFTPAAVLGCVLILLGVVLVEVGPIMKVHGMARALKNLLGPRH